MFVSEGRDQMERTMMNLVLKKKQVILSSALCLEV